MADERTVTCSGHDELREIAVETRKDIQYLNITIQDLIKLLRQCDERIRYLEANGANISQKNAKDLTNLEKRVDVVESNFDVIKGAEKHAGKVAALVAGIVSLIVAAVSLIIQWLK